MAYADAFRTAFGRLDCAPRVLPLFAWDRDAAALCMRVLAQDLLYGGGGSTANLLAVWRARGVGQLMREAAERGALLCGISAGANCWAAASLNDSYGPLADSYGPLAVLADGLGLLPGSFCPHAMPGLLPTRNAPGPESWGSAPDPAPQTPEGLIFPPRTQSRAGSSGHPWHPAFRDLRTEAARTRRTRCYYTALPLVMQGIWLGGTRSGRAVLVSRDPLTPRRPRLLPYGKRRGLRGGGTGPWGLSSPWSGWGRHRWRTRPAGRRGAWTSPRRGR
ncbi:Type 1 glutamine amidotransferase-like domain-containing protein [Streptomyces sp. NPDC058426]|uniref:Type 1 glutamine amidotransferase-like domain-containing protein n=1 Tax=unclassified Streptomyces TaxID=2593676 RepID=UPI0036661CBF